MNTNTIDIYYQQAAITLQFGGGTFARDAARFAVLPHRYVVALGKPFVRLTNTVTADVAKALRELSDVREAWIQASRNSSSARALGTWVHENVVYVDVVESYRSHDLAIEIAKQRGELAIFDTVTGESINV